MRFMISWNRSPQMASQWTHTRRITLTNGRGTQKVTHFLGGVNCSYIGEL